MVLQHDTPCVRYLLQQSTPFQIQSRECSFFSQKVPPVRVCTFKVRAGSWHRGPPQPNDETYPDMETRSYSRNSPPVPPLEQSRLGLFGAVAGYPSPGHFGVQQNENAALAGRDIRRYSCVFSDTTPRTTNNSRKYIGEARPHVRCAFVATLKSK